MYGKSVSLPSIVVQVADDEDRGLNTNNVSKLFTGKIAQTRCPERKSSIEG